MHEEHSSKTFGLRLLLVVYLINYVYMVKKISMETLKYYEKMDIMSEDDNFTLLVKLKISREWFLLWKCYFETDWSEEKSQFQNSVVVIFGPADIVVETRAKNCSKSFCYH